MGWKVMVTTDDKSWAGNALVFETKQEAEDSAKELEGRWLAVKNWRVEEIDEPVNYVFAEGRNIRIET